MENKDYISVKKLKFGSKVKIRKLLNKYNNYEGTVWCFTKDNSCIIKLKNSKQMTTIEPMYLQPIQEFTKTLIHNVNELEKENELEIPQTRQRIKKTKNESVIYNYQEFTEIYKK